MEEIKTCGSFFKKSFAQRQHENAVEMIMQENLHRSYNKQLKNTNVWAHDKKVVKLVGAGAKGNRFGMLIT